MKKSFPIVIVAIVMLVLAAFIFKSVKKANTLEAPDSSQTSDDSSRTNQESTSANCPAPPANTVSYCNGKFNGLTVASGTLVTFRNDSGHAIQPDSDPHPSHTDNPELNVGFMNPGQAKTITLTKKGSWGIHNHIREEETAKIIVQ